MYRIIIQNGEQAESFYQEILRQLQRTQKPLSATLEVYQPIRTKDQNRLYHKLLELLAAEIGDTKESIRKEFEELYGPRYIGSLGVDVPKSCKHWTKAEMSDAIERIHWLAAHLGYVLPEP